MSVVSSSKLRSLLRDTASDFFITPIFDWRAQVDGGSVDIRLDSEFIVPSRNQFASLDPLRHRRQLEARLPLYQKRIFVPFGHHFVLHPGEFALGSSVEFLSFPRNVMAYVIGRSSWGRLGLIIATATKINPGFRGTLTLELVNSGNVPIELYPGVRIAQLVIHELSDNEQPTGSRYDLQVGPGFSKIHKDPELRQLSFPECRIIVGLTGHRGSGKAELANHLVTTRGFRYYSLSRCLRETFSGSKEAQHASRAELRALGESLRRQHGPGFLATQVLRKIQEAEDTNRSTAILVDGIRNPGEIHHLRRLRNFVLLSVVAEPTVLLNNLRHRGLVTPLPGHRARTAREGSNSSQLSETEFWEELEIDKGPSEFGQAIDSCIELAGENAVHFTDSFAELRADFEQILRKLGV